MRKKHKRSKSRQEISGSEYDLAQSSQLGQPLELYPQSFFWRHLCFDVPRLLLIVSICLFFLALFLKVFPFFHLQMLPSQHFGNSLQTFQSEEQSFQLQDNLSEGLFAMFLSLLVIGLSRVTMRTITDVVPKYWLVCRDGLLCVFPKKVEVTRWNEITDLSKFLWSYTVFRSERKSLSFNYTVERYEELADQIRQRSGIEHDRSQNGEQV